MTEDSSTPESKLEPQDRPKRGIPSPIIIAILIVAMLLVSAVGIILVKESSASLTKWGNNDTLTYGGELQVGNRSSSIEAVFLSVSQDEYNPELMTWSASGIDLTVLEDLHVGYYDKNKFNGNIVCQKKISTVFGEKWVDIWTYGKLIDNEISIVTTSVGQGTGLVYEANLLASGMSVHLTIANSTNTNLWYSDREYIHTIIPKGMEIGPDEHSSFSGLGPGCQYWVSSIVNVRQGEELRYEYSGANTTFLVISQKDMSSIGSGLFSYNASLCSAGRTGSLAAHPEPGTHYFFIGQYDGDIAPMSFVKYYWR
jgi:hypothetical protein